MKRLRSAIIAITPLALALHTLSIGAQAPLSLDSCRAMALRNNKQLNIDVLKQDIATNMRKSARTQYLPHVAAIATYQFTSQEMSLLNDNQKSTLQNIGTNATAGISGGMTELGQQLAGFAPLLSQLGLAPEALVQLQQTVGSMQQQLQSSVGNVAGVMNQEGQKIVDAFRTDTRNIWAGTIMLSQPLFMGGAIVAANRIADINEAMAANTYDAKQQLTLYAIDQAYWQVVSLKHKQKLAQSFCDLVRKLDGDVQKMIAEGVATRSEGLSVSVKVNEAEMALTKVSDGLQLSKMLLCQMVGLPMDGQITLADEDSDSLQPDTEMPIVDTNQAIANRPELKLLENTVSLSQQATNIARAGWMPQLLLTGGYAVSNPNVFNGFEKKFGGFWNVGLLLRVPIWNWGDTGYKVRAAKNLTAIANLELQDAREKIELQVKQVSFKTDEANRRLDMAKANIEKAEENLRTANLGFSEGVIAPTVVMEAQTAWLQAQSQKIDAEIDVMLSHVDLKKALGTLTAE